MHTHTRYRSLDLRLTRIFGQAATALQPAAKRRIIRRLYAFQRLASPVRPELAAEALRLAYDLIAELHQAGEPWPTPSTEVKKPETEQPS